MYIIITVPASITNLPEETTVREDTDFVFTCQARGDGVSYEWKREGHEDRGQAELNIPAIARGAADQYTCEATNTLDLTEGEQTFTDTQILTVYVSCKFKFMVFIVHQHF